MADDPTPPVHPLTAAIRNDGVLINALTGLGTERDVTQYTQVGYAPELSYREMAELAKVWPLSKICAAVPDAATSKWCELILPKGADPKILTAFNQYRNVVGTRTKDSDLRDEELASDRDCFNWAGYLANVYRGSAIVINVDDGRPASEPIDTRNIRTIRELEVLDSYQIYPDILRINNPLKASHYNLLISPDWHPGLANMFDRSGGRGLGLYPIHRSRVLRFPGVKVPPEIQRRNNGWDRSLLESIWEQYSSWEEVTSGVRNLVKDYSLFVYQLSGLGDMVLQEQEDKIRARVRALQMGASIFGGILLDKDSESVNFMQRQFSGLKELADSFRDLLIGASGIPHTILFGESPSGLGATGESEQQNWAATVSTYQQNIVLPRLLRLYQLIFLTKDGPTQGEPLMGWDVKFAPIFEQTEAEIIANRASQANIDNIYLQGQVLVPEEVRQSRFGQPYSYETTLDPKAWKKAQQSESPAPTPASEPEVGAPPPDAPQMEPEDLSLADLEAARSDSLRIDLGDRFSDRVLHAQAQQEARSRFRIWPSAYASGWLTQRYKTLYRQKHGSLKNAFTR